MKKKLFCWQCGKALNYTPSGKPKFVVVTLPGGNEVKALRCQGHLSRRSVDQYSGGSDERRTSGLSGSISGSCARSHDRRPLSGDNLEIHGSSLRRCKICQRGRYRLRSGWPRELAFTEQLVPHGYTREVLK